MLKQIPTWVLYTGVLLIMASFFLFAMRGYTYIGYTLIFAALIIVLHHFLPEKLWRAFISLVCVGLIYFCAVELPIIANSRTERDAKRDYLIVLGAAVHGDAPSLALQHRLEGALNYMYAYPESTAILSGGQGKGENMTEAKCMYDWLIAQGVSPDRLIMEPKATSTMENLQYSFDIIRERGDNPDGNIAIVSSSYHLYRAKCMARLLGAEAAGVAGTMGYPIYMVNCYIREAFGVTHLWVLGR